MRPNEFRKFLDKRPFEPIRVEMSTGEAFEVAHSENAIVSRSTVAVAMNVEDGIADHVSHFSLLHVVKVEPLNGKQRTPSRKSKRK